MTLIGKSFSASEIYEDHEGDNLVAPEGEYDLQLETISLKPTKNGNGKFLKCTWKILAPAYQGMYVFDNLNIENPNPQTEQIAEKRYRIMVKASGIDNVTIEDRQLLVGVICSADLIIGTYYANNSNSIDEKKKNEIKKLHSTPRFLTSSTAGVSEADTTTSVCTETAPTRNDFDDEIPF